MKRVLGGLPRQLQYRSEPHTRPAAPPEAPRATAGRRDAHRTPCFEVHAVDASTKLLRPEAHYTVFGRFRFVVDDDRDDDDRGFR